MNIRCKLFGHSYTSKTTEEKSENSNGEIVKTTKKILECEDCGHTKIQNQVTEIVGLNDDNQDESQINRAEWAEGFESMNEISMGEQKDAVVIKDDGIDKDPLNKNIDEHRDLMVSNEGGKFNSENTNNFENDINPFEVTCNKCSYSVKEVESPRRDGDHCPENDCNGWLNVRKKI